MKIKFHYSLLLLFLILIFNGLFVEVFLFFFVIIAHELGHLIALIALKQKPRQLNLTIVGGILDVEVGNIPIFYEILINISGILVNVLLYNIFLRISQFPYQKILLNYNLLMIVFNILPIYPLDGFRIIESFFRLINDPFKEQRILCIISIFSLFLVFALLIYHSKSLSVIILFIFLAYHNLLYRVKKTEIALKKYIRRYNYIN